MEQVGCFAQDDQHVGAQGSVGGGAVGEVLVVDDPKELSGEIEKDEGDASWNPLAQNTERDIKGVFQANLQQPLVVTPESKDTSKWRWWVLITKL